MNPEGKEERIQGKQMLDLLCRQYICVCQVDVQEDRYYRYDQRVDLPKSSAGAFEKQGKFSEELAVYVQRYVWPEDRALFDVLITRKTLKKMLEAQEKVTICYRDCQKDSKNRYELALVSEEEPESSAGDTKRSAVMTIRCITIAQTEEENIKKKLMQRLEKEEYRELTVLHQALHASVWQACFDVHRKLVRISAGDSLRMMLDIPESDNLPETKQEWKRRMHPDDVETVSRHFSRILEANDPEAFFETECRLRTDWGEYRWFRMSACCFREEDGYCVTGVLTDIHAERQIQASKADSMQGMRDREEELQITIARLRQELLEKTEFLTRISHDIRTPVNGIKGLLAMAKTHAGDRDLVLDTLAKAENAELLLEILVDDILHMSKPNDRSDDQEKEVTDLVEMLKSSREVLWGDAMHKGITVRPGRVEIQHQQVYVNAHYLKRVWLNLINCCIKYNQKGGSIERWIIETPINDSHSMYTFILRDSSEEISKEFMQQIVGPLTRSEIGREDLIQKTGLSMVVTRDLAEFIGGTVDVRNEPDAGTIFTFRIPLEICREKKREEGKTAYKGTSVRSDANSYVGKLQGKKILIAEDNELNLEILQYFLGKRGMKLLTARDGKEAVEIFADSEEGSIDLILMDIMMPVMDGLEATKTIRAMKRKDAGCVPILAMTANAFAEDVKNAKAAGMNEHLSKPLNMQKVIQCMNRYLVK